MREHHHTVEDGWVIVGAGPVGIATAIELAKHGIASTVYDKLSSFVQEQEDSYPIGVNPRGLRALHRIGGDKLEREVAGEERVAAWCIYRGGRRVVLLPSNTTVGTTRGHVTLCLYRIACSEPYRSLITFRLGHSLASFDCQSRTLRFEITQDDAATSSPSSRMLSLTLASAVPLIAADGVWSRVRKALCEAHADFASHLKLLEWGVSFRLLFSSPSGSTSLDPQQHHIFGGVYVAVVSSCGTSSSEPRWVIAVQIQDSDEILSSSIASPEHIAALKEHLRENAEPAVSLIAEEEYERFFSRRAFSGAIVQSGVLQKDGVVCVMGDAAHAVSPAIGEGVNGALEDAVVMGKCVAKHFRKDEDRAEVFKRIIIDYESTRIDDTVALSEYAMFMLDGQRSRDPGVRYGRLLCSIALQLLKRIGAIECTWTDKSFGTASEQVMPYREMMAMWRTQTRILLPLCTMAVSVVLFCWTMRYFALTGVVAIGAYLLAVRV